MTDVVSGISGGRWCSYLTRNCASKRCQCVVGFVFILATLYLYNNMIYMMSPALGFYQKWSQRELPVRDANRKPFTLCRTAEVYMYSAFVYLPGEIDQKPDPNATDIVITTLDKAMTQMSCCVMSADQTTMYMTNASIYYQHEEYVYISKVSIARQFMCRVPLPADSLRGSYITLSSTNCSTDIQNYMPILHPTRVPGGLALCAKTAYGGSLEPENLIEWFEVQRLLGVDKIVLFDLGNPETINRVFRFYQRLGILDLQPYELPGQPQNRSFDEKFQLTPQFHHDETMPIFECRQRLGGYDYIIGHDLDEMIIPRRNISLKDLVKEYLQKKPNAAGFHFSTEFFMTTWAPSHPEEDLMVKRFRKSTQPLWKQMKYVYLPSRAKTAKTHELILTDKRFKCLRIPPSDAVLHHYRRCPWHNKDLCSMDPISDNNITRYHELDERVAMVRTATSTKPQWIQSRGRV